MGTVQDDFVKYMFDFLQPTGIDMGRDTDELTLIKMCEMLNDSLRDVHHHDRVFKAAASQEAARKARLVLAVTENIIIL